MKACGEHLIVKLPSPKEAEGAIQLPTAAMEQEFHYGRVLSAGPESGYEDDILVVFDPHGAREIRLDPVKDEFVFAIDRTQLFATITQEELEAANLPIP